MPRKLPVAIPTEMDLTPPVMASSELSNLYREILSHYDELSKCTRTVRTQAEDGTVIVTVLDHPDLKFWAKLRIDCLTKIAALNQNLEQHKIENKFKALDILLSKSDQLPPELKESFIRYQMEAERQRAQK